MTTFDNGTELIFKQSNCVLCCCEWKSIFTFGFNVCRKSNDYLYPQFTTTSGVTTNTKLYKFKNPGDARDLVLGFGFGLGSGIIIV